MIAVSGREVTVVPCAAGVCKSTSRGRRGGSAGSGEG